MSGEAMVEVHLLGLPIDLWERASAHQEAIQRELEIMRASEPRDSVPNRLADLIEEFDARFGNVGDPTRAELQAAADRGEKTIDLTFRVPPPAAEAATRLESMLTEVDEYCRSGDHLMTLATPAELVAFRKWFLEEFSRQIEDGQAPLTWLQYRAQLDPTAVASPQPALSGAGPGTIAFEGSLDLATVGQLRDSIQELRGHDLQEIVVDLTNVGFIESIGIGLLVTTHNRLKEEGVRLRLIVPPRLMELLRLTGLLDLLRPEETAESVEST